MEEPNLVRLDFSVDELNKVSQIARDTRFNVMGSKLLYPDSNEEKMDFFLKGYVFLDSLSQRKDIRDDAITNKLKEYLKQFEDVYKKLSHLKIMSQSDLSFGESRIKKQISQIIMDNDQLIRMLLVDVYPIGKIMKFFDPEMHVGQT